MFTRSPPDSFRASSPGRREHGYALVVAIWITGLAALIVAGFSTSVRTHLRSTAIMTELARAKALADGGITLAALDLVAIRADASRTSRFGTKGRGAACSVGSDTLIVSVLDTAGLVDINWASEALLTALLAGIGLEPREARQLAAAIADYRDTDSVVRLGGAEAEEYKGAGSGRRPKNAPFDSVAELEQVLGIDAELASRISPHVTVHSLLTGIDPQAASPELVEILDRGAMAAPESGLRASVSATSLGSLRPDFVSNSLRRTYRVQVSAHVGRVSFFRIAVVAPTPERQRPYKVLHWAQSSAFQPDAMGEPQHVGDC